MLTLVFISAVFVSVNCIVLPSPCQRPFSIVVPSVGPPCAKQMPLVALPYDLPGPCNPPIKYIEPVNFGVIPGRCGPIAEIPLPEMMMYMGNPFLPAASPVSALAPPFYPYTPPLCPCDCRCQYLKKIPIPPPCI